MLVRDYTPTGKTNRKRAVLRCLHTTFQQKPHIPEAMIVMTLLGVSFVVLVKHVKNAP